MPFFQLGIFSTFVGDPKPLKQGPTGGPRIAITDSTVPEDPVIITDGAPDS
jgi:hypothetical protein